jgi:uncharacterized protein (DUF1778 family)
MRKDIAIGHKSFLQKNGQLNNNIASKANETAKQIFGTNELTLYTARKLYANLASDEWLGRPNYYGENVDPTFFRAHILGHKSNATQESYSHFQITHEDKTAQDILTEQSIIITKLDNIVERLDNIDVPEVEEKELKELKIKSGIEEQLKVVKQKYESENKPTQNKMETKILKGIIPRSVIRLFYHNLKNKE